MATKSASRAEKLWRGAPVGTGGNRFGARHKDTGSCSWIHPQGAAPVPQLSGDDAYEVVWNWRANLQQWEMAKISLRTGFG